jgi:hypothetical protein
MDEAAQPKPGPESATGGCALGCGSLFLIVGIATVLLLAFSRTYQPGSLMVLLYLGGPAFSLGHILAIIAIQSKSDAARQNGKRALLVMWVGAAILGLIYLVFLAPGSPSAK